MEKVQDRKENEQSNPVEKCADKSQEQAQDKAMTQSVQCGAVNEQPKASTEKSDEIAPNVEVSAEKCDNKQVQDEVKEPNPVTETPEVPCEAKNEQPKAVTDKSKEKSEEIADKVEVTAVKDSKSPNSEKENPEEIQKEPAVTSDDKKDNKKLADVEVKPVEATIPSIVVDIVPEEGEKSVDGQDPQESAESAQDAATDPPTDAAKEI